MSAATAELAQWSVHASDTKPWGSPFHLLAHHGLELGGHDDVRSGQELPRLALTLPQRIDSPLRELHGHKQLPIPQVLDAEVYAEPCRLELLTAGRKLQVFIDDLIETVAALEVQQLYGSDAPRIRCCWAYSVMRREGGAR